MLNLGVLVVQHHVEMLEGVLAVDVVKLLDGGAQVEFVGAGKGANEHHFEIVERVERGRFAVDLSQGGLACFCFY